MTSYIDNFIYIKTNRIIKNKNGDYSISLRLFHKDLGYLNGSHYLDKKKENWTTNLKKGDTLTLRYNHPQNTKYQNNISILERKI